MSRDVDVDGSIIRNKFHWIAKRKHREFVPLRERKRRKRKK